MRKFLFPLMVVVAGIMISGATCTPDCCVPGTGVITADQTALVFNFDKTPVIIGGDEVNITVADPAVTWKATASAGWTVTPNTMQTGDGTITIAPDAVNSGYTDKTGTITIQSAIGDVVIVKVTQTGTPTIDTQADFDAAIAALASGDVLHLNGTMTFDIGVGFTIPFDVTINGNGATLVASDVLPTQAAVAYGGKNPAIFITGGNVVLNDLTISTDQVPAPNQVDGITIMDGTLEVNNVTFDGIWNDGGLTGVQHGRCITAYGTSEITVTNCIFQNFNKNGIHMYDTSIATVSDSQFFGTPANNTIGQNGIVFMVDGGHTPTGTVTNCSFEDFECLVPNPLPPPPTEDSIGVLIYDTAGTYAGVTDGGNTYTNCDQTWYIGI